MPLPLGFALRKGSPFLNIFNFYLKRMQESGLLDSLNYRFYESGSPIKDANMDCDQAMVEGLSLKSTLLGFAIVLVGIVISFAVFVFEKLRVNW